MAKHPWPRLSQTLSGPRHPYFCQSCGADWDVDRWREHDDNDKPTATVVVLCLECSERLIEKHPRLYDQLHANVPHPGSMNLCADCSYRNGVSCTHLDLKANGGRGLGIVGPKPTTIFWDGTTKGGGKRIGWIEEWYFGPPTSCYGRDIDPEKRREIEAWVAQAEAATPQYSS